LNTQATLLVLNTEAIRRELAGLADPLKHNPGGTEVQEIKETAIRLCSILAHLFGEALERVTLWAKIDAALAGACAKVSDADLGRFVTLCLDTIQADPARAFACDPMVTLLQVFEVRPPEWRYAFVNHIASRRYAVVALGRQRWEQVKNKEVDL